MSTTLSLYVGCCLLILSFSLFCGVSGAEDYIFRAPLGLDHARHSCRLGGQRGREALLPSDLAVAMQTCNGHDVCSSFEVNTRDPALQCGIQMRALAGTSCDPGSF